MKIINGLEYTSKQVDVRELKAPDGKRIRRRPTGEILGAYIVVASSESPTDFDAVEGGILPGNDDATGNDAETGPSGEGVVEG